MPHSKSRSSTFRNESGNRTYISTTRRMISADELKPLNGLGGFALNLRLIVPIYQPPAPVATQL